MITCKTCSKSFERPKRRGRPPSQCDECKGVKSPGLVEAAISRAKAARSPQKASEAQGDTSTRSKADSGPSVALRAGKKAPYVSGFCNPRHSPDIHSLCSGIDGKCTCECHESRR